MVVYTTTIVRSVLHFALNENRVGFYMDDLRRLIQSAQTHDKNAFGQLVERFQDMAFALAYARVGHRQQAEDIAQEAFIEAYLHIDKLTSPLAFTSWFRVIINRQVNRVVRCKQPSFYPLETITAHSADGATPQQRAESRDLQDAIHNAIHSLSEDERQVILLFYIAGYAQKEIADMLNLRVSTVKSRLYEARKKLRERIDYMVEETLHDQRPSNNPTFIKSVMAFINAIENGCTTLATELLEREPWLLTTSGKLSYDTDMLPPLFLAIQKGNTQLMDYFVSKGANVNGRSESGWSPHHYALNWNHAEDIAAFLVERGANPDIFSLTQMGDLARLKAAVEAKSALVHARGPDGARLLHFARTVEVAEYLLDQGADVNAVDNNGKPAIWYQTSKEIRPLLIERGAVLNDIILACEVGALEQVKAFLAEDPNCLYANSDSANGSYPLLRAALNAHTDVVRHLLSIDDTVNYHAGSWGFAPILAASLGGNLETVQLLVEHGADVNIRLGRAGETALHLALEQQPDKALSIGRYLLENGAEVDAVTKHGATPLHWAVTSNNLDIIRLLLGYGANPKVTSDLMAESPLMRAKRLENVEVYRLLNSWSD